MQIATIFNMLIISILNILFV